MSLILKHLKGDKTLWVFILLFALISFLPVYSSSSNLVYITARGGNTFGYLVRHFGLISIGLLITFGVHRVQYRYFRPFSRVGVVISIFFLLVALFKGDTIGGANASRWLQVPVVGLSFQPSALAHIILMVYVASFLADNYNKKITFKGSLLTWVFIFAVVGLVFIANFSTAAMMFAMVLILLFVGKYPIKYIFYYFVIALVCASFFILFIKAFPDAFPNRLNTWEKRIERFISDENKNEDTYQTDQAKMAIASGGIIGLGPGKSVMRNFLPASSSDFIYAIVVEEYGILGGIILIVLFCLMLVRFIVISNKAPNVFGQLVVFGVGFSVIFQAFINMGVAVGLLPVTGQTLPFFTTGGTSVLMTCLSLGIILAVSAKSETQKTLSSEKKSKENSTEKSSSEVSEQKTISEENNLGRETLEQIALS